MFSQISVLEETQKDFQRIKEITQRMDTLEYFIMDKIVEAENLFKMFNLVPAAVYLKNTQNCILQANDFFFSLFNLKREDVINKDCSKWAEGSNLSLEQAKQYWANDLDVVNSGEPKLGIIERMSSNLNIILRTDKIPMKNNEGIVTGVIGFSVDVTDLLEKKNG